MRQLRSALAALLVLIATDAGAKDDPGPPNSTIPAFFAVVALDGQGAASPAGEFVVTVRDIANNPVPGAQVKIDFSGTTDVALCTTQPDPDLIIDCAGGWANKLTDGAGQAHFRLVGRSTGVFSPGLTGSMARIYANGTLLGYSNVTTYDVDGSGELGGGDLSEWLRQFSPVAGSFVGDYDGSGALGGGDLALWLSAFASGTQIQSGGPLCP